MRVWNLSWSVLAVEALRAIPWRDAARVDAAMMRFAQTGEGDIERIPDDPTGAWIRVGSYKVRVVLERHDKLISVLYVWRSIIR